MEFESTFEQLTPELSICVTPDHKFGTEAFLLAHFAGHRRKDLACDLCTGCGIVALLWFRDREQGPRQAYCVEIQPKAVEQLKARGIDKVLEMKQAAYERYLAK